MTDRYVGPGGSDGASGLSWAFRKETLNGVEDTPVVAGDTIYVGPGTYRETLTVDVSGSGGSPITYVGDVLGLNTDGVGGEVRIAGCNSDEKTVARANNILTTTARDYRTFRGFLLDATSGPKLLLDGSGLDNWIIEDCVFGTTPDAYGSEHIRIDPFTATGDTMIIRRCSFHSIHGTSSSKSDAIYVESETTDKQFNLLIENCIIFGGPERPIINLFNVYDVYIKNNTIVGYVGPAKATINAIMVSGTNKVYLYNNVLLWGEVQAETADCIVDDYNYVVPYDNVVYTGLTKGSNTVLSTAGVMPPTKIPGFVLPHPEYEHAPWSNILNYGCGNSPPSEDFYGIDRPATDSKKTRGAVQFSWPERETTTVPSGETESIKLRDAMAYQIFIPITGKAMSFEVQCYREANYAGTNPQMIIRQPGQSARTTTDIGSSGAWNTLSDSFTPASAPAFVVLEIRSNNTATSGDYDTFFGAFEVK